MAHVVTQHCCNDAAYVAVCPVNCIHPGPSEAAYRTTEMLYIDPDACIDCGACADVCPVGAILPDYDIEGADRVYIEINASHFREPGARDYRARRPLRTFDMFGSERELKVAIVGSGPAGCYAADELLKTSGLNVRVDMLERLPVPWGLARFGVAPDHQKTKEIIKSFERTADDPRFRLFLGVEVGRDVSHQDLARGYDGVIYATGALSDRKLGIPGEDLPGSHSATEFAAWYNGHPDFADLTFNLDTERAVIVGNGNVALDVARILASDVDALRKTDIAEHALEALARSRIQEIVILARRSPLEAAFTVPELIGLTQSASFSVRAEPADDPVDASLQLQMKAAASWTARRKLEIIGQLERESTAAGKTVTLAFLRSPVSVVGNDSVAGLRIARNRLEQNGDRSIVAVPSGQETILEAGLLLRSVGYRGTQIEGLPFDDRSGAVPNAGGRIVEPGTGVPVTGAYVTGWIRRGPSGTMGTNKKCAQETVAALLQDHANGLLRHSAELRATLSEKLARCGNLLSWRAIDHHERQRGRQLGRPRVKLVNRMEMAAVARARKDEVSA